MLKDSKTYTQFWESLKSKFITKMFLYWNFAEGTTVKAQGTMAIALGAVGYFEACL